MGEEVIDGAGGEEGLEAGGEAGVFDREAGHAYVVRSGYPGFDLFGHLMGFRPPLLGEGEEFFAVEGGFGEEAQVGLFQAFRFGEDELEGVDGLFFFLVEFEWVAFAEEPGLRAVDLGVGRAEPQDVAGAGA